MPETPFQRITSLFRRPFVTVGAVLGLLQMCWRSFPRIFHFAEDAGFAVDIWTRLGGNLSMIVQVVSSPLFGLGLIITSIGYALLDERIGQQPPRTDRIVSIIGWSVVAVCAVLISSVFMFESFLVNTHIVQFVDEESKERHISSAQRAQIKATLNPYASMFHLPLTVAAADNPEANAYAIEIMDALVDAGIQVQSSTPVFRSPFPMRVLNPKVRGVFIQVKDIKNAPPEVKTLTWVLAAAEIKAAIVEDPILSSNEYALTIGLK